MCLEEVMQLRDTLLVQRASRLTRDMIDDGQQLGIRIGFLSMR